MLHIITVVRSKYCGCDAFQYVSVMRTSVETETRHVCGSTLLYGFFVQNFLVISHPEQIIQKSALAGDEREGEGEK